MFILIDKIYNIHNSNNCANYPKGCHNLPLIIIYNKRKNVFFLIFGTEKFRIFVLFNINKLALHLF